MSDKPEAMQEFRFPRSRRFPFFFFFHPFLFRIPPVGFFIGFLPRPRFFEAGDDDPEWCIRRISEAEFAAMTRLGFPEMEVMMQG